MLQNHKPHEHQGLGIWINFLWIFFICHTSISSVEVNDRSSLQRVRFSWLLFRWFLSHCCVLIWWFPPSMNQKNLDFRSFANWVAGGVKPSLGSVFSLNALPIDLIYSVLGRWEVAEFPSNIWWCSFFLVNRSGDQQYCGDSHARQSGTPQNRFQWFFVF